MIYSKTHTLWKRDMEDGKHKGIIIPGEYSKDEFKNIRWWHITEKVDGMNIRIEYENDAKPYIIPYPWEHRIKINGRTDKAVLPKELSQYLEVVFSKEVLAWRFPDSKYVCLFGEGYGYKIQKNGQQYNPNQEFVLFDVFIDGWWLKQEAVTEIANFLGIPRAPVLGIWTKEYAQDFIDCNVKNYAHPFKTVNNIPLSILSVEPREMEGVMCRSEPLMLFRDKSPIRFKLKVSDFQDLYNEQL